MGSHELRETNKELKKVWGEIELLRELINAKKESSRKKEENNLVMKEMLQILEQANLNSGDEILDLETLQNKLVNNFEINNSIQLSLENLNNFCHDQPSIVFLINKSIKNLSRIADFDLEVQKFRDKFLNILADVELSLIHI